MVFTDREGDVTPVIGRSRLTPTGCPYQLLG